MSTIANELGDLLATVKFDGTSVEVARDAHVEQIVNHAAVLGVSRELFRTDKTAWCAALKAKVATTQKPKSKVGRRNFMTPEDVQLVRDDLRNYATPGKKYVQADALENFAKEMLRTDPLFIGAKKREKDDLLGAAVKFLKDQIDNKKKAQRKAIQHQTRLTA